MNDAEQEFANLQMIAGRDALFQALRGVSEVQSNFSPGSDCWSIAECVEHVALTEDVLLKILRSGAAKPDGVPLAPDKDRRMAAAVVDRSRKVQAAARIPARIPEGMTRIATPGMQLDPVKSALHS
ncbi:MAG: hypothetical protein DMG57_17125 [Acidobacteria bacterium]|nr:MAG: hypothetical protein DMG57_17125 [Acidobacteriota bacterium]